MDEKQRDIEIEKEQIEENQDKDNDPGNGIIEEDGKAYILCGDARILLPGGYVKLKKRGY